MTIIWRYLLGQYLKVLILCVVAFIAVLLTTRLDDIAHFTALGPEGLLILRYALHQIPYILPIAIPVSCLISTVILVQRLSQSHELTAFRASGMSLRSFLAPILITAAYLTLVNFYVVSEMATSSHLATNTLKNTLRSINPLLLLHNKHIMRSKGFYFDAMGGARIGERAQDVVLALPNNHGDRLNLLFAKDLKASSETVTVNRMTLISSIDSDQFMIENIGDTQASIEDFSQIIQKDVWKIKNDHLRLSLLLTRLQEEKTSIEINRCYTELIRRFSVAIAAFTFTLMGASFGISISRYRSHRRIFTVIGLASLYLICYFVAKGMDHQFVASTLLYLMPHVFIITLSIWTLNRISRGKE